MCCIIAILPCQTSASMNEPAIFVDPGERSFAARICATLCSKEWRRKYVTERRARRREAIRLRELWSGDPYKRYDRKKCSMGEAAYWLAFARFYPAAEAIQRKFSTRSAAQMQAMDDLFPQIASLMTLSPD